MIAKIYSVQFRRTKAGDPAVEIVIVTENDKWIKDFIGINAPDFVAKRWLSLIGNDGNWNTLMSMTAFDLIGLEVEVECEDSDYGQKIKKVGLVKVADQKHTPATAEDVPF